MKILKSTLAVIALAASFSASANGWRDALELAQKANEIHRGIVAQQPQQQREYQPDNREQHHSQRDERGPRATDVCMENVKVGMPSQETEVNKFVCHEGYAAMFNTKAKIPMWVAEQMRAEEIFGDGERAAQFSPDPSINARLQANRRDYSRSGWDQGHMAPAANFSKNQRLMDESFYYTNILPQNPDHNRKFWSALEKKVRNLTASRKLLYVVSGPVFNSNQTRTIGNGVAVPDGIFKVVYDPRTNAAFAIMSPNAPLTERDIPKYLVSVREVERATGLNFLSALPTQTQDIAETRRSGMWTR